MGLSSWPGMLLTVLNWDSNKGVLESLLRTVSTKGEHPGPRQAIFVMGRRPRNV